MATLGKRVKLPIIPGVNPSEDSTPLDTIIFADGDKIRFQEAKLKKIGGWKRIFSQEPERITGAARNIFSCRDAYGDPITIIGTHTRLYAYVPENGQNFYNITPLNTTTIPIPNSFSTEYNASVTVPMQTTIHSPIVTLELPNYFQDFDEIVISGVSGTYAGIPASSINGSFLVNALNNASIQINVGTPATSTGYFALTMTWAAGYLYVNYPAFGLPQGDRIKIQGSTDVANILAAAINIEQLVTNIVSEDVFTIQTGTVATSLVTAAGGSSTTLQTQIAAGNANVSLGYGYGGGQYGAGAYGDSKIFNNTDVVAYPRIWSMDKYGSNLVLTPGDGPDASPNVYIWMNFDITVAPVLITAVGSQPIPTGVRWLYVSNNSVCLVGCMVAAFGQSYAILNQFYSSDQANPTGAFPSNGYDQWDILPSTYAYTTILEQSGPFISQASARNHDLIFTSSEVYNFQFINKPNIWLVRKLFTTDGIVGPKARAEIEDAVFWMGQGDFYVFDGYTVNVLPNNTVKRYVYDNINWSQSWKCFVFANVEFSEVWFFYPSGQDIDPNNYVIYNYKESHWSIGTMPRTAAEEPTNVNAQPLMIQSQIVNTIPIPNSLSTFFYTLGANPLTTVNTSDTVTAEVNLDVFLEPGDTVFISGATDTNGILASNINGVRTITSSTTSIGYGSGLYGVGNYGDAPLQGITFTAGSAATSSGTGGGSHITIGTSIIGINSGLTTVNIGDTLQITGAAGIGGIPAYAVNTTSTVRYITGTFQQVATDVSGVYSTSRVIDSGGPNVMLTYSVSDRLFQHEVGVDDYNPAFNPKTEPQEDQSAPMLSYATTCYAQIQDGDNTMIIYSLYPDIKQSGEMSLGVNVKLYAQAPISINENPSFQGMYTLLPTTQKVDIMKVGRQRQYYFESNVIGGNFLMGNCYEEVKESSTR
jgi:hypothetical protein